MPIFLAKYGEQTTIRFPVVKRAVVDLAATADWTPATGDTKISKDGGNVANTTNNPAAVGGTGSVLWSLTLTGLELQAAEIVVQIVDSATKAVEDQTLVIYTYGHPSAKIPADLCAPDSQPPYPAEVTATPFNSDTTAHAVNMPAATEAGDLLICLFANDGTATVTTPTGWTQLHTTTDSTDLRLSSYAKKADGTEGGTTVGFTTSSGERAAAQVYRFKRGEWYGDSASSFAQSIKIGTAATGSSTTPNPPSCAPAWSRLPTAFIAVAANDNGTVTDSAYPSNYVDRTNTISDSNAAGVSLSSAIRSQLTTSEDPGTYTISTEQWVAQTIAVRPAQMTALFGPYVFDALTVTGQLAIQNGIDVSCTTSNRDAVKLTGNGTGHGIHTISGGAAGANGMRVAGVGATTSTGLYVYGSGAGGAAYLEGGSTGDALTIVGGGSSGKGITITTTSGDGISISATGHALNLIANGTSKHGLKITGSSGGTGDAINLTAGAGGVGARLDTLTASGSVTFSGVVTASNASNNIVGIDVAKIAGSASAATNAKNGWDGLISDSGTAQAGGSSTITLRAAANSTTNDYYKNAVVAILSGPGAGLSRKITAYTASTRVATVDEAWGVAPDNTSTYQVLGRIV